MLPPKKRDDPAGRGGGDGDDHINFAYIVLIGMDIGYSEKEVGRMYMGKWCDLYFEWKTLHNIRMNRMIFKDTERVTPLMDL